MQGWRNVRVVGGSGDLAADILGVDPHGRSVAVQCKRYAPGTKVGSPVIQTVLGMAMVHHRTDRAMVVTTSSFTKAAEELATRHGVELWDGVHLAEFAGGGRWKTRRGRRSTILGIFVGACYLFWPLGIVQGTTEHGATQVSAVGLAVFAIWLPLAIGVPLWLWYRLRRSRTNPDGLSEMQRP